MKKIMILGAGASQIPLIRAAKRLGYHTVVTSIPGNYPGFRLADTCCHADISKPEEVLREALRLRISGITTCGMDTGIRALGRVCDELGLPGISYGAACTLTNKYLSKRVFQSAGVPCAKGFRVKTHEGLADALERLGLPVAVKAVDLMGSNGIYRCNDRAQALDCFAKAMALTSLDYCLVEEFLDGTLFGAEGMLTDGKPDFLLPYGTDVYYGSTVPTSIGHFVPFSEGEILKKAEKNILLALKAAGVRTSPFNCDLMLKDGEVYLIEINGRAGASCLSETVGISYGVDYYEALCRQAMGDPVNSWFDGGVQKASVSRILTAPADGILERIRLPALEKGQELTVNVRNGDPVRCYRTGRDRLGQIIVSGNSLKECRASLAKLLLDTEFQVQEWDQAEGTVSADGQNNRNGGQKTDNRPEYRTERD